MAIYLSSHIDIVAWRDEYYVRHASVTGRPLGLSVYPWDSRYRGVRM